VATVYETHYAESFALAPELEEALRDCITEDGAASLAREDMRGLEYARQRLHAINDTVRAVLAKIDA